MKAPFLILFLFPTILFAQKTDLRLDANFQKTMAIPRYFGDITKKEGVYVKTLFYHPESTQYMGGTYLDAETKVPHGSVAYYFPNRKLKSDASYNNGKLEGLREEFSETGRKLFSAIYTDGHISRYRLRWNEQGVPIDSSFFDGKGNGELKLFHDDGSLYAKGKIIYDSFPEGKWEYFYANGKKWADVSNEGVRGAITTCYDSAGRALPSQLCVSTEPVSALTPKKYKNRILLGMQKGMDQVMRNNKEFGGVYDVVIEFTVNPDGTLSNFTPLTSHGEKLEEYSIEAIKYTAPWIPGKRFGQVVPMRVKEVITYTF